MSDTEAVVIGGGKSFSDELELVGDKSISHRGVIFSFLSSSTTHLRNYSLAEDTLCTVDIARSLGAKIIQDKDALTITPPKQIMEPSRILDCGNSGTAMRLYAGLLAPQNGMFVLSGDKYLNVRPMDRIINPLNEIGAKIRSRKHGLAPLVIEGASLKGFSYESSIASAQVKTAIILAAFGAKEKSTFTEPQKSRDHSENMLKSMGANLQISDNCITINPLKTPLSPLDLDIPSDPSSAFFFACLVAIGKNCNIKLKNILLNPTRILAFEVLAKMGVHISYENIQTNIEKRGDIIVRSKELNAITIDENIAYLIDEIPALAVVFAFAKGVSHVKGARELRVKESDRIKAIVSNLRRCGINTQEFDDGFSVEGGTMQACTIDSFGDHRIAMSFAIGGFFTQGGIKIKDPNCVQSSFVNFFEILQKLGASLQWK